MKIRLEMKKPIPNFKNENNADEGEIHESTRHVKHQRQFMQFDEEINKGCCIPIIQISYSTPIIQIPEST